jgi:exonuclease SbcC
MRILSLRFKNLNSLAGEWRIDFTNPEYVSSGIFAITGPTGAGKSTILDAICLALYGRTPRLGKISRNAGEIMTRQTGEYFSEVEFVSEKGHFRCMWHQKRAYREAVGELQSPKHEIIDAKTGVPIESRQAAVQQKVIEVTGLDYQQFTRSILLAQGEFATFLDAKAEERAPILEKITGTEIYGQISIKVHERFGQEKATLGELTIMVDTLDIIPQEQVKKIHVEKEEHEIKIKEISAYCKTLEDAVAWLVAIETLETEIAKLQEQKTTLTIRKENAKTDLGILCRARKARDLEGVYSGLSQLRVQQESDSAEKKSCEKELVVWTASYAKALAIYKTVLEKRDTSLLEKQKEDEIIKVVRELDTRIHESITKQNEREKEKHRLEEDIKKYNDARLSAEMQLKEIQKGLSAVNAYLESHVADQKLIESLSGIESSFRHLDSIVEKAEKKKNDLSEMEKLLSDAEQSVLMRKKDMEKLTFEVQKATTETDRTKKEFADITGGQDISALRVLADEIKDHHDRLRSLLDLVSRIEIDTAECEKHSKKIKDALNNRIDEEKRYEQLQKEESPTVQLVKLAEEKLLLQSRVRSLEEEREKLVEGTPCPLCGSTEHPWCNGVAQIPDGAHQELETYKKGLEKLQNNIRQTEVKLAAIGSEIHVSESVREDLKQKIESATVELQNGCNYLNVKTSMEDSKSVIAAALGECTTRLERARETLTYAETKEGEIRSATERLNNENFVLTDAKKDYDKVLSYRDIKIDDRDRIKKEITAIGEEYLQQKVAILDKLQEYESIIVFSAHEMAEQILTELTERRDAYTANILQRQELEKSQQLFKAEAERNRSLLSEVEKGLENVSVILSGIYQDLNTFWLKRHELYDDKDPAAGEVRVTRKVEEVENELSIANDAKILTDKQKNSCEAQIQALNIKILARMPVLQNKEQDFSSALAGSDFTDENKFNSARLSPDTFTELEKLEADLMREDIEISTSIREKTSKLIIEQKRTLTTGKREDLIIDIENQKNRMTELQIDIGRLNTILVQYDTQIAKYQALTEEIIKQKKEFAKWEKLHNLIGSADGKKFRVFAQGLTFETLVVQANRHLRAMSDRYLLVRNKDSPLDLDIIDNYQAGEIRTTKNLSGGERFLVSLALALGLSGMASYNVRIDSLFLDEGFGTLDEDTLETALETLSSLKREGKIIGIISHVSAIKERIAVQIQVEKIGGGRSRLYGPGCSGPR